VKTSICWTKLQGKPSKSIAVNEDEVAGFSGTILLEEGGLIVEAKQIDGS
jgi:hypothetical protein